MEEEKLESEYTIDILEYTVGERNYFQLKKLKNNYVIYCLIISLATLISAVVPNSIRET